MLRVWYLRQHFRLFRLDAAALGCKTALKTAWQVIKLYIISVLVCCCKRQNLLWTISETAHLLHGWPSGLRRQTQALAWCERAPLLSVLVSLSMREFESHFVQKNFFSLFLIPFLHLQLLLCSKIFYVCILASVQLLRKILTTTAGLEPTIFGSEDRRVIHYATWPHFVDKKTKHNFFAHHWSASKFLPAQHGFNQAVLVFHRKQLAASGFDPPTSGLWAQHASAAPRCSSPIPTISKHNHTGALTSSSQCWTNVAEIDA